MALEGAVSPLPPEGEKQVTLQKDVVKDISHLLCNSMKSEMQLSLSRLV
jgi:hypothetical protein